MNVAYADTSVLVALAFREPSAVNLRRRIARFDRVVTSVFAEAELASALARESVEPLRPSHFGIDLIATAEPLAHEIQDVLTAGYLKGGDCWHVAVALNYSPDRAITFLTMDKAQRTVAAALGFKI